MEFRPLVWRICRHLQGPIPRSASWYVCSAFEIPRNSNNKLNFLFLQPCAFTSGKLSACSHWCSKLCLLFLRSHTSAFWGSRPSEIVFSSEPPAPFSHPSTRIYNNPELFARLSIFFGRAQRFPLHSRNDLFMTAFAQDTAVESQKCFHETIMGFNQTQTNSQFFLFLFGGRVSEWREIFLFPSHTHTSPSRALELLRGWGCERREKNLHEKLIHFVHCTEKQLKTNFNVWCKIFFFLPPKSVWMFEKSFCAAEVFASSRFDVCPKTEVAWLPIGIFLRARKHATCRFHNFTYIWMRRRELRDFIMLSFSCFLSCTWHIVDVVVIVSGKGG